MPTKSSPPRPRAKPRAAARPRRGRKSPSKVMPVEVAPDAVEQTLAKVREELAHWVKRGRYTKVRFKLRGRPILPDLPVGAVLAAEAATFWWAGLLRALLVTVGAKAVLDVEVINEADREVALGKEALLSGEVEGAAALFRKALAMDRDHASAHLSLGVACKLQGDVAGAREWLEKAERLDPSGPVGAEARKLRSKLGRARPGTSR